jgi:hypothetical protein
MPQFVRGFASKTQRVHPSLDGPQMITRSSRFGMFYASRNVHVAAIPLPRGMKGRHVMTKRNIVTAAVAALGALAIAFTLVVSSPAAEAQVVHPEPDKECMECTLDRAICLRDTIRALWRDGEDIDMGCAMSGIGKWQKCELENCRSIGYEICALDVCLEPKGALAQYVWDTCSEEAICEPAASGDLIGKYCVALEDEDHVAAKTAECAYWGEYHGYTTTVLRGCTPGPPDDHYCLRYTCPPETPVLTLMLCEAFPSQP